MDDTNNNKRERETEGKLPIMSTAHRRKGTSINGEQVVETRKC